ANPEPITVATYAPAKLMTVLTFTFSDISQLPPHVKFFLLIKQFDKLPTISFNIKYMITVL
ncbi:hypothetical protein, partial [Clostridioides difficile]|uniref:hypothetical protein n=1 Tax=Clostridioides difficile TaxID=1496 RepID=UPI001A9134AE